MKTRTQPTYSFGTMIFRPRARQYLANDLIITVVCLAGLAVAGIDGVFMGNVLLWASLAIAVCLVYRFLYLRSMRFVITDEQFIYEHGVYPRLHGTLPHRGFPGRKQFLPADIRTENDTDILRRPFHSAP